MASSKRKYLSPSPSFFFWLCRSDKLSTRLFLSEEDPHLDKITLRQKENRKFSLNVFLAPIDLIYIYISLYMYVFRYMKRILKILWKRKYHCMHSSLHLLEPLDAIVGTQERQSQTILITNLTPQRWKRTVPLSLHQALLLSEHPKVIRKMGLPPSTCLAGPQNPKAVALVIFTDMEGKLQGTWRALKPTVEKVRHHLQTTHFTSLSSCWSILVRFRKAKSPSASEILYKKLIPFQT